MKIVDLKNNPFIAYLVALIAAILIVGSGEYNYQYPLIIKILHTVLISFVLFGVSWLVYKITNEETKLNSKVKFILAFATLVGGMLFIQYQNEKIEELEEDVLIIEQEIDSVWETVQEEEEIKVEESKISDEITETIPCTEDGATTEILNESWQLVTFEEYDFSFELPKDWEIDTEGCSNSLGAVSMERKKEAELHDGTEYWRWDLNITVNTPTSYEYEQEGLTFEEWIMSDDTRWGSRVSPVKEIQLDGETAYTWSSNAFGLFDTIMMERENGLIYDIVLVEPTGEPEAFAHFLESFSFTD
ncbi:MAG: hypothetical protein WC777_03195 [Candidatus Gracilibacteria bacterium]|jgi:hypothetical protein